MSAADDAPAVMNMDERAAWAQLIATGVTSLAYAAVVIPRVVSMPVAEVSWVPPMLISIGVSLVAIIVGPMASGIAGAAKLTMRGRDVNSELGKDSRDHEISAHARLRAYGLYTTLAAGGLGLAMIDADKFWIGNWIFLVASVASIVEASSKIRAYRRGFAA